MKLLTLIAIMMLSRTTWGFGAENPQLSADRARMLEAVRASSLQYTQNLPNFICTQITRRRATDQINFGMSFGGASSSRSGSGLAGASHGPGVLDDVIEERLTFFDQMEHYEVVTVNGKTAAGQQHMQFGGAISAGEFGSALLNLFNPRSHAEFSWDRMARVNGRTVNAFKFVVPSQNGTIVIERNTDRKILAAYSGRIFVDGENLEVVRITSELVLPIDFPIAMATVAVDYKPVQIAGKMYNLPSHSEVRMKDRSRLYVNEIEFRNYHKFAVESTIHYDGKTQQPKQ